jgi:hypothetical protein
LRNCTGRSITLIAYSCSKLSFVELYTTRFIQIIKETKQTIAGRIHMEFKNMHHLMVILGNSIQNLHEHTSVCTRCISNKHSHLSAGSNE